MTREQQPPPSAPRPTDPPARARLTVWHSPPPDQPGCLTVELAQRLLDEHTQAGQVIIDLDDDPGLPGIAAATDRDHHALDGHTDPDVIARYTAGADLLLLHWPRPATNPRHLLQTAHTLLKDAGLLALVVHVPAANRAAHLVALTGAAHNVGFHLLRHIVAVAPTDGPPGPSTPGRAPNPHTELLILQRPQDKGDPTGRQVHDPRGGRPNVGMPTSAPPGSPTDERHRLRPLVQRPPDGAQRTARPGYSVHLLTETGVPTVGRPTTLRTAHLSALTDAARATVLRSIRFVMTIPSTSDIPGTRARSRDGHPLVDLPIRCIGGRDE
jgi:hypothetical protein